MTKYLTNKQEMDHTNGMGPVKIAKGLRVIFRMKKINRIRLRLMILEKWQ